MTTPIPTPRTQEFQRLLERAQRDRRERDAATARPDTRLREAVRARRQDSAVRRGLFLPEGLSLSGLRLARPGQPRLGPGRHRVSRFPRRFRGDGDRARPPAHRPGDRGGGRPGDALRRHHRRGGRVRRGDLPAVRPRDAALRELRHRGDDGRHPGRPGGHGARRRLQDRRLVPRPPRRRDVLGRSPMRTPWEGGSDLPSRRSPGGW